jgi:hypothetical protein
VLRFTVKEILTATFGLAAFVVLLEHAGGFSRVVSSSAGAYAETFGALTGHPARGRR